jgi:hypothetical protein
MKRVFLAPLIAGSILLLNAETRLGQPMTLRQPLSVDQVVTSADSSVGKTIQVKGKVTEVCQMAGCWMQLSGTGSNAVRIKVNDGDIVFPQSAVGKTAIAEGKLQKIELTREQALARARHEADERGSKFNPASVKTGTTFYQIQGTGALVLE